MTIFPLILQTITIAQTLSTGGEGKCTKRTAFCILNFKPTNGNLKMCDLSLFVINLKFNSSKNQQCQEGKRNEQTVTTSRQRLSLTICSPFASMCATTLLSCLVKLFWCCLSPESLICRVKSSRSLTQIKQDTNYFYIYMRHSRPYNKLFHIAKTHKCLIWN